MQKPNRARDLEFYLEVLYVENLSVLHNVHIFVLYLLHMHTYMRNKIDYIAFKKNTHAECIYSITILEN